MPVSQDSRSDSTRRPFGVVESQGGTVEATLFELSNQDLRVRLTDFGATLVALEAPDRAGQRADVALGYNDAASYGVRSGPYLGAVVGRYANRIAKGRFELDGEVYRLPVNNGPNSLHGGLDGLSRVPWSGRLIETGRGPGLELRHLSPDGAQGYPGDLDVTVRYSLVGSDLVIEAEATTSRATVVNLSFHGYFNLAGHDAGDILSHEVCIPASYYTPVDDALVPTGEIAEVAGTPMDLRCFTRVGQHIDEDFDQLRLAGGYDHNWVVDRDDKDEGELAAAGAVRDPVSGRQLEVLTTQPGVQFYTGNFLDGATPGKGGATYARRCGLCLETQHFPDAPNQPNFPSTVLRPGGHYRHTTVYRFSCFD